MSDTSFQYDRYCFVNINECITFLENDITQKQSHCFHLTSVSRISRLPYDEKTVVYFDNGSFIILKMNDVTYHEFRKTWASAIFEEKSKGRQILRHENQSHAPTMMMPPFSPPP